MATAANKYRRHVEFAIGDRFLLRLQPYRQLSVGRTVSAKLGRWYYGPFEVTDRIGAVAYCLKLPIGSRIHDVFHVSSLKPFTPPLSETALQQLPKEFVHSRPVDVPITATDERTVIVEGIPQCQWKVRWSSNPSWQTWELKDLLLRHFPSLTLEDKVILNGEGVDRDPMETAMQHDEIHWYGWTMTYTTGTRVEGAGKEFAQ